jgi:hypothetical protein
LHTTPELLGVAVRRFHRRVHGRRKAR